MDNNKLGLFSNDIKNNGKIIYSKFLAPKTYLHIILYPDGKL